MIVIFLRTVILGALLVSTHFIWCMDAAPKVHEIEEVKQVIKDIFALPQMQEDKDREPRNNYDQIKNDQEQECYKLLDATYSLIDQDIPGEGNTLKNTIYGAVDALKNRINEDIAMHPYPQYFNLQPAVVRMLLKERINNIITAIEAENSRMKKERLMLSSITLIPLLIMVGLLIWHKYTSSKPQEKSEESEVDQVDQEEAIVSDSSLEKVVNQ
jgi:hypothetical protein